MYEGIVYRIYIVLSPLNLTHLTLDRQTERQRDRYHQIIYTYNILEITICEKWKLDQEIDLQYRNIMNS